MRGRYWFRTSDLCRVKEDHGLANLLIITPKAPLTSADAIQKLSSSCIVSLHRADFSRTRDSAAILPHGKRVRVYAGCCPGGVTDQAYAKLNQHKNPSRGLGEAHQHRSVVAVSIGNVEPAFSHRPELESLTCVSCGRTEWYAIDPATMQQNFGGVSVAAGTTITAGA
jgi:hypothetical protein